MPGPKNVKMPKRRTGKVRQDGRPEAFDLAFGDQTGCIACFAENKFTPYPRGEVFMVNPQDNPTDSGTECYLCTEHLKMLLPNVVIADPMQGFECRDFTGKRWREGLIIP